MPETPTATTTHPLDALLPFLRHSDGCSFHNEREDGSWELQILSCNCGLLNAWRDAVDAFAEEERKAP